MYSILTLSGINKTVSSENNLPSEIKLIYFDTEKGLYLVSHGKKQIIMPPFADEPNMWSRVCKIWWNERGEKIGFILNRWDGHANHYSLWELNENSKDLKQIKDPYDYKTPDDSGKFETNFLSNPQRYLVANGDIYRSKDGDGIKIVDFLGDLCYFNRGFTDLKISNSGKYLLARKIGTEIPWFSGNDIIAMFFHRCILCVYDINGDRLFEAQGKIYYFDLYEPK